MIPVTLRLELRRPAMWLGIASGVVVGWIDAPSLAVAAGALAAVAAAGELPLVQPARQRALRSLVPLLGVLGATLMRGTLPTGGVVCAAIALTAMTIACLTGPGISAADAASGALVVAATAVAAMRGGPAVGMSTESSLLVGWLAAVTLAASSLQGTAGGGPVLRRTAGVSLGRGPLPAEGPIRRVLNGLAMVSMLAAMAGWLLLAPEHAAAARDLALAWFFSLAVPAALLQDGAAVRAAWDRIIRSAASAPGSGKWPALGPARVAAEVAWCHAAVIAWPGLVAMAVGLASPNGVWPAAAVVGGVCGAAIVVTLVSAVLFSRGASGESALAVVMALGVAALALLGPRKADVEQFAASCQTRLLMQAAGRPPFKESSRVRIQSERIQVWIDAGEVPPGLAWDDGRPDGRDGQRWRISPQ